MKTLTISKTEIERRYEPSWIVATLPPQRYALSDALDFLRPAMFGLIGPAARFVSHSREEVAACVELPVSAEASTPDFDQRLRRRLLPRCEQAVAESVPDDFVVAAAFEASPGTLTKLDDGWGFRLNENETGLVSVRGTPGGMLLAVKLIVLSDRCPVIKEAVGAFLGRAQRQLRLVRIVMREEAICLEGWVDAEYASEDTALTLDAFRQVVLRLRRSLHALTFDDVAQAYVQCGGKSD